MVHCGWLLGLHMRARAAKLRLTSCELVDSGCGLGCILCDRCLLQLCQNMAAVVGHDTFFSRAHLAGQGVVDVGEALGEHLQVLLDFGLLTLLILDLFLDLLALLPQIINALQQREGRAL